MMHVKQRRAVAAISLIRKIISRNVFRFQNDWKDFHFIKVLCPLIFNLSEFYTFPKFPFAYFHQYYYYNYYFLFIFFAELCLISFQI